MTKLRETAIRDFLLGEHAPEQLNTEALQAIHRLDDATCQVDIEDMSEPCIIDSVALTRFCDAVRTGRMTSEALRHIAFAIIASDQFDWQDNLAGEVLHDWAAPEINYPLTAENMNRFSRWLLRQEAYPAKPRRSP
jgi:hypothetical protein